MFFSFLRQGFFDCIKHFCQEGLSHESGGFDDSAIEGVASCIGLAEGMGPGPASNWHDFKNKQKMMIMNSRGTFGFCMRQEGRKC